MSASKEGKEALPAAPRKTGGDIDWRVVARDLCAALEKLSDKPAEECPDWVAGPLQQYYAAKNELAIEDAAVEKAAFVMLIDAQDINPPDEVKFYTEPWTGGHFCPCCGERGHWRSGQEFDNQLRCFNDCSTLGSIVWEPGKRYRKVMRKTGFGSAAMFEWLEANLDLRNTILAITKPGDVNLGSRENTFRNFVEKRMLDELRHSLLEGGLM
jgi:hypothetical protein